MLKPNESSSIEVRKIKYLNFFLIDRFILRGFLENFLISVSAFVAIYFFSTLLTELPSILKRAEINPQAVTLGNVLKNYIYKIPDFFLTVYPFSYLFSTSYILGSFYKNNEIVACITAGWSMRRITVGIVLFSIFSSILLVFMNNSFIPNNNYKSSAIEEEIYRETKESNVNNLQTYGENGIIYLSLYYNSRTKTFSRILLLKSREKNHGLEVSEMNVPDIDSLNTMNVTDQIKKITGENFSFAKFFPYEWMIKGNEMVWDEPTGKWIVKKGFKWSWNESGEIYNIEEYDSKPIDLVEKPAYFSKETRNIKEMTTEDTKLYIEKLKKSKQIYNKELVEFYSEKYAKPFSVFILALLSSALGRFFSRKHLLVMTIFFSFIIAAVYYVLINIGISLGKEEILPALPAAFLGNILSIGIYFFLKRKQLT